MPLTELPFHLPGRIFRSPMPFGDYDPQGEAFAKFKQEGVSVIVLLAEDAECLQKAKRHLRDLYAREGFQVIYLPIPDFSVPSQQQVRVRHDYGLISLLPNGRPNLASVSLSRLRA